jgi:hypothetical protein
MPILPPWVRALTVVLLLLDLLVQMFLEQFSFILHLFLVVFLIDELIAARWTRDGP